MARLDAEEVAEPERNDEPAGDRDQGEQVIATPGRAGHPLEELAAVEDANAVEKHDEPGEAHRSGDLRLRGEGADGEADEQHGADAEREAEDADLPDEVAEA